MIDIAPRNRPQRPDPRNRPSQVAWALRLWLVSGALLIVLGVLGLVFDTFFATDFDFGLFGVDVLIVLLGALYFVMGAGTYRGVLQWRSSFSALTCVVVALLLPLTIGFQSGGLAIALAAAIVGLIGSILANRPLSDRWFKCQLGDCPPDESDATTGKDDSASNRPTDQGRGE